MAPKLLKSLPIVSVKVYFFYSGKSVSAESFILLELVCLWMEGVGWEVEEHVSGADCAFCTFYK